MSRAIFYVTQLTAYFTVGLIIRIIIRPKVKRLFQKINKPLIIASNHQHFLDPFFVMASLSFKDFLKCLPIRFITANKYMKFPLLPLLLTFGCYKANKEENYSCTDESIKFIKNGFTVFIFPEGGIVKEKLNNPKIGVGVIAIKSTAKVLPVNVSLNNLVLKITFGSFLLSKSVEDPKAFANKVLKVIYEYE
ncbi:MAG: 1-acyl-sn-glycerol-3-phosphate acyltransferase [Patescibacteria group bacterium]